MKSDARTRFTKRQIKEAFFQLLEKEPFPKITVTEICSLAEINRSTFYKHYCDTYDLLQKSEEELLEDLRSVTQSFKGTDTARLIESILQQLRDMDHMPFYHMIKADPGFSDQISCCFCQEMYSCFQDKLSAYPPPSREMVCHYVSAGSSSILSYWFSTGMKLPVHRIATLINDLSEKILR